MEEDRYWAEPDEEQEKLYEAAKDRLKAVRARVMSEVEERLRLNFTCITGFLLMDAQSEFDKLYTYHMYRTYGFDADIFFQLKDRLAADGQNLNLHLRTLVRTSEPTADELVQSATYMIKLHFRRYFIRIIEVSTEV